MQSAVADTSKIIKRREEQLRKLEASREELQVEEARLSQSDSLASVDAPMVSDAASVGAHHVMPSLIQHSASKPPLLPHSGKCMAV